MRILGISGLVDVEMFLTRHFPDEMAKGEQFIQGTDAAAALVDGGRVVAAVSQERIDRIKKSAAFPEGSIRYCLAEAGIEPADLDHVCFNFNYGPHERIFGMHETARAYWQNCLSPAVVHKRFLEIFPEAAHVKVTHVDHHLCHAHAALMSCDFDDALVVVFDASAEICAISAYHYANGTLSLVSRYPVTRSLGLFYSLVTKFLGFTPNEDEYKVMGLAALGDPATYRDFFEDAIRLTSNGGIEIPSLLNNDSLVERFLYTGSLQTIEDRLGFSGRGRPIGTIHQDVSSGLQERFTEALMHLCRHFQKKTGAQDLVLSGGCAENCSAIGELRKTQLFRRIHVGFASGDEGTSLGAAAAVSFREGFPIRTPAAMPFLGPRVDARGIPDLAREFGLRCSQVYPHKDDFLRDAAQDVANSQIIAMCDGRMEFGARALGNRSILALPKELEMKDRINLAIKKRQSFRPFAPAVLEEDAPLYFDLESGETYPYMTMLMDVCESARGALAAIVHIDGTARVQTVNRIHNPSFYKFLVFLREFSGCSVVLNTSFNVNHQPIMQGNREAVETFANMGIDALYLAGYKLSRGEVSSN